MNAAFAILAALAVAVGGYRWYAGYVDRKVLQVDPQRVTPAKMYMDGVDFMPTSKNVLFGYQFKSIAGAAPVIGAIVALQWGWLPALLWLFLGVAFIGWLHDYISGMVSLRNDGLSLGALSYKLISPRARVILLSFIYFYLLLIAGAFGAVIAGAGSHPGPGRSGAAGGPDDLPLAGQRPGDHAGLRRPGPGGHQAGRTPPGAPAAGVPGPE
jgi:carbon starvation protein